MIKENAKVTLEYSIFDRENNELDTSRGLGPITIQLGQKQIWPVLEQALADMETGQTKRIDVEAKEAFGPVVATAFKEIDINILPEDSRKENAILGFNDEKGEQHQVRVHAINDQTATLDFNHPLAGQDVTFEIHVIDVENP